MAAKKPNHYVDNDKLQAAMVEYKVMLNEAKAAGLEKPRIPYFIGECIMKIATHLAFRPNFANYSFREEMISDGMETCCRYIHNYDPATFDNPHAYFTTTIWRTFVQRIKKEKMYHYKKHLATLLAEINNNISSQQEHDTHDYRNDSHSEWSQEHLLEFMDNFERSKGRRKKKILDK